MGSGCDQAPTICGEVDQNASGRHDSNLTIRSSGGASPPQPHRWLSRTNSAMAWRHRVRKIMPSAKPMPWVLARLVGAALIARAARNGAPRGSTRRAAAATLHKASTLCSSRAVVLDVSATTLCGKTVVEHGTSGRSRRAVSSLLLFVHQLAGSVGRQQLPRQDLVGKRIKTPIAPSPDALGDEIGGGAGDQIARPPSPAFPSVDAQVALPPLWRWRRQGR